ncbi:response regulator transcription factor [Paenibacillus sp. GD4]|uniref:response regulator n=1 Tax=Paenibacillus sp. GD4 TaxID=3068890 RepID=UPI002796699E|nr:response regulator transcription factor [Paenibacillus sp. GD4]MDQ1911088.1 response regulator transcription factor [Paenibacillus sp. GD4]
MTNNIRIMLVDDQDLIRESLHIVLDMDPELSVEGLAENGQAAVELAQHIRPDVILMDIHMPVMDGVGATRRIKGLLPETKIIILTTFQEVNYVVEALAAGAEGYLLKAIHPKELAAGLKWVHRGGTLIPQEIALLLVKQLKSPQAESAAAVSAAVLEERRKPEEYGLSEREFQVLKAISEGLSNREIAGKLFLSEGTVKNYISSIYAKLDVRDRLQASLKAREEGMV